MDFDMKKLTNVTNRSSGATIYRIPEHNIRREFAPGETKQVTYEELVWLSNQPGGSRLMQDMLLIRDAAATEQLVGAVEPEYHMTEADVIKLLQEGSVDELLDALDFAPAGVIDIIKDQAVKLPLYDMRKRDAILKATGFDVTAVLANSVADEEEEAPAAPAARRVQKTEPTAARRAESRYKVVEE